MSLNFIILSWGAWRGENKKKAEKKELSVAVNFWGLREKVAAKQWASWVILNEYGCHGEVQPVLSISESDISVLWASGDPSGKKAT